MGQNEVNKSLFHRERMVYKFIGITDEKTGLPYKIYSFIVIVFFRCFYPVVVSIDLFTHTFDEALDSWVIFNGFIMVVPLTLITFQNRFKIGKLLNVSENVFYEVREHSLGKKLVKKWMRFKNFIVTIFAAGVMFTTVSQFLYCLILRITKENPNDWYLGFDTISVVNTTYSPNYELVYTYQIASLFYCALQVTTNTFLIMGLLNLFSIQFKILQQKLNTLLIDARIDGDNSQISWKYLKQQVNEVVSYHQDILKMVKEFEKTFSGITFSVFFGTLCLDCVEIYRASSFPLNDIRSVRIFAETLLATLHMIIICAAGENMTTESENVAKAIYKIDFVGTDIRFQKCLIKLIEQAQITLRVKAGKLTEVSVVTIVEISRTIYSFYAVLKSLN
ncbi:hypothetical protein FQA39_LY03707 [Lamprigera yunnana]|nr:hypothetical protein FQA39_LY03707 [Lamprigera yunnana]